jgi:hypothetical protein
MGRTYAGPTKVRTNIYTVAIGESGSGKTSLVAPAKELLLLTGVPGLLGHDRIASSQGLLQMLTTEPRRVCFLDEFGHMLQQIGAPGAGSHLRAILNEFTRLFSAANALYTGTAWATREAAPIDSPHLCLFGMSTPEQFWRAFGSSNLEDGSVARFLVFPVGAFRPKVQDERYRDKTVEGIRGVLEAIEGRRRGNLGVPELLAAPWGVGAEAAYLALQASMQGCAKYARENGIRGADAILLRVAELAQRVALISAVGRDPVAPVISTDDFDIGHVIVHWSANEMIRNIGSHVADNQIERDHNDVERRILKAGPKGILRGTLKARCAISACASSWSTSKRSRDPARSSSSAPTR